MDYTDKTIGCVEYGSNFTFSASEQEFFANRGYTNEPNRCPPCRQARKEQHRRSQGGWDSYGYQRKELHPVVCASCGKEMQKCLLSPEKGVLCTVTTVMPK